jgi:hypothetical protein
MAKSSPEENEFTPEQTAQRRDTLLLQLLKTPPQSREKLKAKAKLKPSRPKAARRKSRKKA